MGPPIHAGTLVVWFAYQLAAVTIALRAYHPGDPFKPQRTFEIVCCALPVAAGVTLGTLYLTGWPVVWTCNCGSFDMGTGNNHFDEDVIFAHLVTVFGLLWSGISGEAHRRLGLEDRVWPGLMVMTVVASVFCWGAVTSRALGCS